jgi:hypothetical protein
MPGDHRQQKKPEKSKNPAPYDNRNAKKPKNNTEETTSLATEIATVTQTRDANNNNNNNQNASGTSQNNIEMEVETLTPEEPQPETESSNINLSQHYTGQTAIGQPDEDWNQVAFKKRHTIYVNAEECKGETQGEKRQLLEEDIENAANLLGISTKKIGETHIIKIDLISGEDKLLACQALEELNINYRVSLKGKETEIPDAPKRSTELVVKDIPLGITKDALGRRFSLWGRINRITLVVNGGWQTAHIFYDDPKSLEEFHSEKWSVFFKKDSLRTTPGESFQEYKEARNTYVLKLCNLPKGTTAYDISDYISNVKGKTCFIPRTRAKYERVRYAFIAFETEQDARALLQEETPVYIKENHVMWLQPETKTCHICQGREHLAANCPRIQERTKNERKILKFSDLYKRKRVNADNVDTIHKKAAAITQRKSYSEAAQTTVPASNGPPSIEARLARLERTMNIIQTQLNRIIEKHNTTDTDEFHKTIITPKETTSNFRTPRQQHKTPEKKPTHTEKPKNQSDIETSIHNPTNSEKETATPQTAQRMSNLENSVDRILQMLNQLQNTPKKPSDTSTPMETQTTNTNQS